MLPGQEVYFKGDRVELTGETETVAGRVFLCARLVEGHRCGGVVLLAKPEAKQADIEESRRIWREQQDGFRRLKV